MSSKLIQLAQSIRAKYAQSQPDLPALREDRPTVPDFGPGPNDQAETTRKNVVASLERALESLNNLDELYRDYNTFPPFHGYEEMVKHLHSVLNAAKSAKLKPFLE